MKIYYVVNARLPTEKAHGIQIAKMCEALIEAGADIELIAPHRLSAPGDMREFYGLRVDVSIKYWWVPDWYGNRIGFVVSSFLFALRYFGHLFWKYHVRREDFTIYTTDIDQFSFFLIPFLGIPYFVEMHDAKKKTLLFALLLRRARGIIVINRIIRRELIETFALKDDALIVLPNGVDLSLFQSQESASSARALLGIPEGRPVAMYVGRVYGWKGLEILPVAAAKLRDVLFYLVGGTADEMRAIGAMRDRMENLICMGPQPFREIPRWLRAANVLIATGTDKNPYSFLHTSPMKLFEYAAAGRPIVAARTPAIADIFTGRGGRGIFFYTPDSADDLARAVRAALADVPAAERQAETMANLAALYQWKDRAGKALQFIKHRV